MTSACMHKTPCSSGSALAKRWSLLLAVHCSRSREQGLSVHRQPRHGFRRASHALVAITPAGKSVQASAPTASFHHTIVWVGEIDCILYFVCRNGGSEEGEKGGWPA